MDYEKLTCSSQSTETESSIEWRSRWAAGSGLTGERHKTRRREDITRGSVVTSGEIGEGEIPVRCGEHGT